MRKRRSSSSLELEQKERKRESVRLTAIVSQEDVEEQRGHDKQVTIDFQVHSHKIQKKYAKEFQ